MANGAAAFRGRRFVMHSVQHSETVAENERRKWEDAVFEHLVHNGLRLTVRDET